MFFDVSRQLGPVLVMSARGTESCCARFASPHHASDSSQLIVVSRSLSTTTSTAAAGKLRQYRRMALAAENRL
jgi:wobble nucleotide-excising tRNase